MKSLNKMLMIFICFLFFSISFAQSNWTSFIDSTGNLIRMKINRKTGIPQRLYGLNFNFTLIGNVTHQNIELLSRRFFSNYSKLFKLKIDDLKFQNAQNIKGKWYVNFKQYYQNIPVRYAEVGFVIDKNGNVMLIGSDFHPDISIDVNPAISLLDAKNIADLSQKILDNLKKQGGIISVGDKSSPEIIYQMFGVSKKTYKKAIGALFKKRLITIENNGIKLNKKVN